jgi:6-phosphogluconolactonase (cycloisomerase 2 family)
MRTLSVLLTSFCLVIYVSLLASCGSTSSNNTTNSNNPAPGASGGGNGSGSGSGSGSGAGSGSGSSGGSGSGTSSSFVSYAYAASDTAIVGYGVNSDGSLAPLPGSPYAASLAQNANIVTNGANLYAIAQGATNLDVFSIDKSSGSLTLANTANAIAGDPFQNEIASGLALDHTGSSLYVDDGVSDLHSGLNVFTVGSGSSAQQIQFLPGPAIAPPPPVFSPNNQFAYSSSCGVREVGVFGYERAPDGTVKTMNVRTPQAPTGNPGEAFCPHGLAVSAKGYLAIVWFPFPFASSGQVGNETYVMTYTINSDGTLTAVSNSQVKTASTSSNNSVVANFDPTGSFLAVGGDGGVQTFAVNANGALTPVGTPQNPGVNFQNVAWDTSNHLFAANSSQLYVFNSSTGVLAPASGSPHAGNPQLMILPLR